MNVLGMDWVTGFTFGIEFPSTGKLLEEDDEPWPWLVVHLGIVRFFITKYEVE